MNKCKECGSCANNVGRYGRDNSDSDLCDVCYWRVRYERSQAVREYRDHHEFVVSQIAEVAGREIKTISDVLDVIRCQQSVITKLTKDYNSLEDDVHYNRDLASEHQDIFDAIRDEADRPIYQEYGKYVPIPYAVWKRAVEKARTT